MKRFLNYSFLGLAFLTIIFGLISYFLVNAQFFPKIVHFSYYNQIFWGLLATLVFIASSSQPDWAQISFHKFKTRGINILAYLTVLGGIAFYTFQKNTALFESSESLSAPIGFWAGSGIAMAKFVLSVGFLSLLFAVFTGFGRFLLKKVGLFVEEIENYSLLSYLYAFATTSVVVIFLSFAAGVLGIFNTYFAWASVAGLIGVAYKEQFLNLKRLFWEPIYEKEEVLIREIFLALGVSLIIAWNVFHTLRPLPIGWDAANLYINLVKLTTESGGLVSGYDAYNWTLLVSFTKLITTRLEAAFAFSMFGGVLAASALFATAKRFVGQLSSFRVAALFLVLPTVIFQSTKDLKTDLGILFLSLVLFNALLSWFEAQPKSKRPTKHYLIKLTIFIGILLGVLFGAKYTAFITIVSVGALFVYNYFGIGGALATVFASIILTFLLNLTRFSGITFTNATINQIYIICGLGLAISGGFAIWKHASKEAFIKSAKHISILAVTCIVAFAPWLAFNYSTVNKPTTDLLLRGRNTSPQLIVPSDFTYEPPLDIQLPEGINVDLDELGKLEEPTTATNTEAIENSEESNDTATENTEATEKAASRPKGDVNREAFILRYLGYEPGFNKFFSLPHDTLTNSNVFTGMTDLGFVLIAVFGVAVAFAAYSKRNSLGFAILILVFATTYFGLFTKYAITNCAGAEITSECVGESLDSQINVPEDAPNQPGFYKTLTLNFLKTTSGVATPVANTFGQTPDSISISYILALTTLPTLLLVSKLNLPTISKLSEISKDKRTVFGVFTTIFLGLWYLMAGGIYWYGFLGFTLMLALVFVVLESKTVSKFLEDQPEFLYLKATISFVFGFGIFSMFLFTFQPNAQIGTPDIMVRPLAESLVTTRDEIETLASMNKGIADGVIAINEDPEGKVYRIGTLINYYIDNNNTRVFNDQAISNFAGINATQSGTKYEIAQKLKAAGFKFLVIDLNTASIDNTPGKVLTQRANKLDEFVKGNIQLKLVSTDRIIQTENGEYVAGYEGEIAWRGTVAVFEIL